MLIFLFWIGFCAIVGVLANNYRRNVGGWVILAFFISPLLAGLFLLASGKKATPAFGYGVKKIQRVKNREVWGWCADKRGHIARYTAEKAAAFAAQWNEENKNPDLTYKAEMI
jgi:hypothetical protein